jgi:hypothetical protein
MPPAFENGTARLPTIQDVDSVTTVRDFAYEALDTTSSTTSDGMNTPLSKSISGPSTLTGAASAVDTITHDPNKPPYTTFYDASWTLSGNQLKPPRAQSTGLPLASASMEPPLIEPDVTLRWCDLHNRHISDRSFNSEYSQYSTPPLTSKNHYRGQSISYQPMETLLSNMEVQMLKDGSAGKASEGGRGVAVVDLELLSKANNMRTESTATQSSSKFSQYSTL